MDEIKAAAIREEKAARRARLGIEEEEVPASQVGNRRYARGRAYVPDRYTNPANAAAATEKAAAESEGYVAPEETETELSVAETPVEETVVDTAPKAQAEEEEEEEVFFVEEDSDETSN